MIGYLERDTWIFLNLSACEKMDNAFLTALSREFPSTYASFPGSLIMSGNDGEQVSIKYDKLGISRNSGSVFLNNSSLSNTLLGGVDELSYTLK